MYLDNATTLDELKRQYKHWAIKLHPDMPGGDEAAMKRLNNEYDAAILRINRGTCASDATAKQYTTTEAAAYRDIIIQLIKLAGINIELCGTWIWIAGDTYRHKEDLKALGCKWSRGKSAWYWAGDKRPRYGSHMSMEDIRQKYGSKHVDVVNDRACTTYTPA